MFYHVIIRMWRLSEHGIQSGAKLSKQPKTCTRPCLPSAISMECPMGFISLHSFFDDNIWTLERQKSISNSKTLVIPFAKGPNKSMCFFYRINYDFFYFELGQSFDLSYTPPCTSSLFRWRWHWHGFYCFKQTTQLTFHIILIVSANTHTHTHTIQFVCDFNIAEVLERKPFKQSIHLAESDGIEFRSNLVFLHEIHRQSVDVYFIYSMKWIGNSSE